MNLNEKSTLPEDWDNITSVVKQACSGSNNSRAKVELMADLGTEMSIVLKLKVLFPDKESIIYVKKEKKNTEEGILKREYGNLLRFNKLFEQNKSNFSCEELLGYFETDQTLVLKECPGDCFFDLIKQGCGWFAPKKDLSSTLRAAESCGKWLTFVENTSLGVVNTGNTLTKFRQNIDIAEGNIKGNVASSHLMPLFSTCKNLILNHLDTMSVSPNDFYLAHGDFHPGNFFIQDEERVSAIDFQHVGTQLVGYDALYFELQLLLSFGPKNFHPWHIGKLSRGFFLGYGRVLNQNSKQTQIVKAQIVIRALVYLASTCVTGGIIQRFLTMYTVPKLVTWLNKRKSQQSE